MATKTISIELDVYERLRALKRAPSESFSQVLRRELAAKNGIPAIDLLRWSEDAGGLLGMSEAQLNEVESFRNDLGEWEDPWKS